MAADVDGGLFILVVPVIYITPVPVFFPRFPQHSGFCAFWGGRSCGGEFGTGLGGRRATAEDWASP